MAKTKSFFNWTRPSGVSRFDVVRPDLDHRAAEVSGDFAVLDAVLDVGQDPVLDVIMQFRSAMDQGHARAVPPEIERRDGGRIFASDDQHIHVEKRMGLAIVVKDLGKVFSGNIQRVREIVVSGRDNQLAGVVIVDSAHAVGGRDLKITVAPGHGLHPLVLADIEMIVLG